jgi:septum formation protein
MSGFEPAPVVLASQSAIRKQLLTAAGVEFESMSPGVDEEAAKAGLLAEDWSPRDIADHLAELKAVRVSRKLPGVLVIGADTTLDLDGVLYDKATDIAGAREKLQTLRGKTHRLHSAVVVARDGIPLWRDLASPRLSVRFFSDEWLEDYLAREGDKLLWSVGCYELEGLGVQLFDKIEGDYFAVLGLPMLGLLDFLRLQGALPS